MNLGTLISIVCDKAFYYRKQLYTFYAIDMCCYAINCVIGYTPLTNWH
jgi:hypothetical protein